MQTPHRTVLEKRDPPIFATDCPVHLKDRIPAGMQIYLYRADSGRTGGFQVMATGNKFRLWSQYVNLFSRDNGGGLGFSKRRIGKNSLDCLASLTRSIQCAILKLPIIIE
jgi:hypothetical protein